MLDQVQNLIHSASGQTAVIAMILEASMRLIKTDKPLSIAHLIAGALHKIGDISGGLANLLDKVLPQNTK